jgi:hypothetical protein
MPKIQQKITRTYVFRIIGGVILFFAFQYVIALVRLSGGSASMKNKFSALAQDKYMDFLVMQNLFGVGKKTARSYLVGGCGGGGVGKFSYSWVFHITLGQDATLFLR